MFQAHVPLGFRIVSVIAWPPPGMVKLTAVAGTLSASRPVPPSSHLPEVDVPAVPQATPARLPRPIVIAHVATLLAAFATWAYLDRDLWFFGDEWDFLTRRGLHGAHFSLWAPHNEHWSVLPILLWRAIYSLEHLSSYWPYLVPLLLAHVAVVHLVWRRCMREGADPWVATALGLLLGFLGAGAEDLVWAFQIGFLSSLLFGLLAMEVAEGAPAQGEAPYLLAPLWPRRLTSARPLVRDAAAAGLALAALMCSTVGVASCVALAVLLLGRSGWRRAFRALVVPLCAYGIWFAFAGRTGLRTTGDYFSASVFLKVPTFVASNMSQDLGRAAGWARLGRILAATLVTWALWRGRRLYSHHPAVLGGALAAVAFYAMAATGRDRISPTLTPSRYAYVGAAFLIPALSLMLTDLRKLAGRWQPANRATGQQVASGGWATAVVPVTLMLIAAATVGNAMAGVRFARGRTDYVRGLEDQIITSAAYLRGSEQLARAVDRYPIWASGFASGYLTPSVLADLARHSLLPEPGALLMRPTEVLNDQTWLDVTGLSRPLSHGLFRLLGSAGLKWSDEAGPPGSAELLSAHRFAGSVAGSPFAVHERWWGESPSWLHGAIDHRSATPPEAWRRGPGSCARGVPADIDFPYSFPASLRLGLTAGVGSGSVWVSLGPIGGNLLVSLAHPWGLEGLPGSAAVQGQVITIAPGGYTWVNDRAAGDNLLLQLPRGRSVELCGLSPSGGDEA